ncbi:hypothetical protein HMPREF0813_01097 [Streptococcus anginosus F0211]|uniref:Uncharacterized protein n=1 Tax=Streptococcus anginosus F0211 TaxID=706437 RepID=E6J1H2_STRAP|nr:hypothetical protein SanJ4206_1572c [Streptococcus anginosus]EFU22371.1 hypothetical protein HMPREF0813_01097 [Streptococcus anginosus F0211]ETS96888.1 hypothetical protein HMPREF1512_0909 [Streptococcus sp. OBRC6]EUB16217.1 hypothetical protein HMPREF1510_1946 [Streptococcus sp. ACC21]EUC75969.1 hypothetical protein HMPREF1511_1451 [Streptococcus sp. CM7]EWC98428.1 hypothetical protein HMPREF1509_0380 [Streptococcus sp. AC15]
MQKTKFSSKLLFGVSKANEDETCFTSSIYHLKTVLCFVR